MHKALRAAIWHSSAIKEEHWCFENPHSSSHAQQQQRKEPPAEPAATRCTILDTQDAEMGAHLMLAPQGLM